MKIGHAIRSLAIPLAVLALLLFAAAAPAQPAHRTAAPAPFLPLEEEVEVEFEEEWEEDEESEEEIESGRGGEPPEECGLRTARASAIADESQARVRTQVNYTSFEPVRAEVDFRLSGPKGSITVGRARKRLSHSGEIRDSEQLSQGELEKALAAQRITVTVRVLEAPASCRRYSERHLKSRNAGGDRIAWLQFDSVFGS